MDPYATERVRLYGQMFEIVSVGFYIIILNYYIVAQFTGHKQISITRRRLWLSRRTHLAKRRNNNKYLSISFSLSFSIFIYKCNKICSVTFIRL